MQKFTVIFHGEVSVEVVQWSSRICWRRLKEMLLTRIVGSGSTLEGSILIVIFNDRNEIDQVHARIELAGSGLDHAQIRVLLLLLLLLLRHHSDLFLLAAVCSASPDVQLRVHQISTLVNEVIKLLMK